MADAATEALVNRIVTEVSENVVSQLGKRMDDHDARLDELADTVRLAAASVTATIQRLLDTANPPGVRPPVLDAACAADPAAGTQRVTVDVHGRAVTEYVRPGDDPAAVWADMCAAVAMHAHTEARSCRN